MPASPGNHHPARVFFILPTMDVGGAERVVVRTAARLDRRRFSPEVVALVRSSGRLETELRSDGIPFLALSAGTRPHLALPWRFWRVLRERRPTVLVSSMFHANLVSRVLGHAAGVPLIVTSERVVGWESPWRILANRHTAFLGDAVTTNSQAGVDFWRRALGQRVSVHLIYNGVDTNAFHPAAVVPECIVIGNLARLHEKNGQKYLLEALALIREGHPRLDWQCKIRGDGPERDALARTIRGMNLDDRVRVDAFTDVPAEWLRSLSIYVQPSIAEGFPNAVLEAMASGLPVIATHVGGTPELIVDGATGVLVPPRDPARLAEALVALLSNVSRRAALGAAARQRVQTMFSVERMVHTTEDLLDHLLGDRAGAAASAPPQETLNA